MSTALLASRALVAATRLVALPAARRATNHHSPNARFVRSAAGFASAEAPPAPTRRGESGAEQPLGMPSLSTIAEPRT